MIYRQRSTLSVPGHVKKMHDKAFDESAADVVMLDLEDSVPLESKALAREQIISTLQNLEVWESGISVRVNGADTPYCFRDVIEIVQAAGAKYIPLFCLRWIVLAMCIFSPACWTALKRKLA
jgi:citrate lyase beta subunit